MGLPSYIAAESGGCLLTIKAQPRARSTAFAGMHGGALKIRIASPPVDGAANEALVEFLADFLGCGRRQVAVARGAASSHKVIRITGMNAPEVAARMALAGISG
jgi:uncharacterized protein (TIGR00251 family)